MNIADRIQYLRKDVYKRQSQKNLFVVPNHLTEQWGAEFLQLYPGANILVATKKEMCIRDRCRDCGGCKHSIPDGF